MGVGAFYRWLVNKYPKIVVNAVEKTEADEGSLPNRNGFEVDNLYLDMSRIIHTCFDPEHDDVLKHLKTPATYEEIFSNIYEYIDRILEIARPRKLLYLAIDGVAPRAKMNQQRTRRFRNSKDHKMLRKEEDRLRRLYIIEGRDVLPQQDSEESDSNIITPGTTFMFELSRELQNYIHLRISRNHAWKHLKVILSDANAPGEGEHKIMSFIRLQRTCPGYDPNTNHVLYGQDTDLIMLALATHEIHLSILREYDLNQGLKDTTERMSSLKVSTISKQRPFLRKRHQFLHIWILREYLSLDLRAENLPENFEYDTERLIDDFIFVCSFGGNDFLPHMPTLDIREGAIDLLIHVYKQEFKNLGGYLVNMEKVHDKKRGYVKLKRVQKFILVIGAYEDQIFKKRSDIFHEIMVQSMVPDIEDDRGSREEELFSGIRSNRNPKGWPFGSRVRSSYRGKSHDNDIVENTKALKKQLKSYTYKMSDLFKNGLVTDMVKLGAPGWRERYYKYKFSAQTEVDMENMRKELVQKYFEGLCWVLLYYFSDVPSWTWFFPYHYGPFASDFEGLSSNTVIFQRGSPFKPFDQLMAVLPPTSVDVLPPLYRSLMTADDSSILDFYPGDFDIDADGKRFLWLGTCKLPFIEEDRLLAATKKIEKELSEEEAKRNAENAAKLFVHSSENLALQIISSLNDADPIKQKGSMKIDTSLSGDINGFVHPKLDPENVGLANDLDVLCVYYDPPCFSPNIPRVLEGTVIPEPVVSESDIQEGHLWHDEDHCYPSRTKRSYGATRIPKEQTNSSSWWNTYGRGARRNGSSDNISTKYNARTNNINGKSWLVRSDSGSGSDNNQARRRWGDTQSRNGPVDATRW